MALKVQVASLINCRRSV